MYGIHRVSELIQPGCISIIFELIWSIGNKFGCIFRIEVVIELIKLIVQWHSWHFYFVKEVIYLIDLPRN